MSARLVSERHRVTGVVQQELLEAFLLLLASDSQHYYDTQCDYGCECYVMWSSVLKSLG